MPPRHRPLLEERVVAAVVDRSPAAGRGRARRSGSRSGPGTRGRGRRARRRRAGRGRRTRAARGRRGRGRWWARRGARRRSGSAAARPAPPGPPGRRRGSSSGRRGRRRGRGRRASARSARRGRRRRWPSSGRRRRRTRRRPRARPSRAPRRSPPSRPSLRSRRCGGATYAATVSPGSRSCSCGQPADEGVRRGGRDGAGVRGEVAGEDPQQGGLAGAVGADDADHVARARRSGRGPRRGCGGRGRRRGPWRRGWRSRAHCGGLHRPWVCGAPTDSRRTARGSRHRREALRRSGVHDGRHTPAVRRTPRAPGTAGTGRSAGR